MAPCSNLDDPIAASVQAAAVEAAKRATFAPAKYNGKPVDKGFQLRYVFDPNDTHGQTPGEGPGLIRVERNLTLPIPINIPKANYPSTWTAGLVTVKMLIFEDGLVHYAGALSGHRDLRRAAVQAACKATFQPATREGRPVKSEFVIERNFYNVFERG